jgi:hypothetical protein
MLRECALLHLDLLRAALRRMFLLDLPTEPDEDEVSRAAFNQWIAGSKHPPECVGGCRCEGG